MSTGGWVGSGIGAIIGFTLTWPLGPAGWAMGISFGIAIGGSIGMALDPIVPDAPQALPASSQYKVSTAQEGLPIYDVLGTALITGNIVYFGNEHSIAQTSEVQGGKGGGGSSSTITGYLYYKTWIDIICLGPIDTLHVVRRGDDIVWKGTLDINDDGYATIELEGMGEAIVFFGTDTQVASDIIGDLLEDSTLNMSMRNVCYVLYNDCVCGTYDHIATMKYVVTKRPSVDCYPVATIGEYDYNPICAIYYLMTERAELSASVIASTLFANAAHEIYAENAGISLIIGDKNAAEYIDVILTHIRASKTMDSDGNFGIKLLRYDTMPSSLMVVNKSNSLTPSIARPGWIKAINMLNVAYTERIISEDDADEIDFKERSMQFDDMTIVRRQGKTTPKNMRYDLFFDPTTVNNLADRTFRELSYPFATIDIQVNRSASKLRVGDLFRLNYPERSIDNMVCRIRSIDEGDLTSEQIQLTAVEDVDYISSAMSIDAYSGLSTIPNYDLQPLDNIKIIEAPFKLAGTRTVLYLYFYVPRITVTEAGYHIYISYDGGISYKLLQSVADFAVHGTLVEEYSENTDKIDDSEDGILITFDNSDVSQLESITRTLLLRGYNEALIGDEIICFQSITPVIGFSRRYRLTGIYRNRYDSVRATHAVGTHFYYKPPPSNLIDDSFTKSQSLYFKIVPYNDRSTGDISEALAIQYTILGRSRMGMPPSNLRANGTHFNATFNLTDNLVLTWNSRLHNAGAGFVVPTVADPSYLPAGTMDCNYLVRVPFPEGLVFETTVSNVSVSFSPAMVAALYTYGGFIHDELEFHVHADETYDGIQYISTNYASITVRKVS